MVDGTMALTQTLNAPNLAGVWQQFGRSFDISDDGLTAVATAFGAGTTSNAITIPETYLMTKDASLSWTISPLGSLPGDTFTSYGSLALSGDGTIFVVGNWADDSPGEGLNFGAIDPYNQNNGSNGGAAVYRLDSVAKTKTMISFLKPKGSVCCSGRFGSNVSTNGDGSAVAITMPGSNQIADEFVNPETIYSSGGDKGSVFLY